MGTLKVEVSYGEVVDKITILEIKRAKIADPEKRAHVERELRVLRSAWDTRGPAWPEDLAAALYDVNLALWNVEDALRQHEASGDFGPEFVAQARTVYRLNDRRADLKRQLNARLGSDLVEVKDHVVYP